MLDNDNIIEVRTSDIHNAQIFWEKISLYDEYEIKEPIKVKFDWRELKWKYCYKIKTLEK